MDEITISLILVLIAIIYYCFIRPLFYWRRQGVQQLGFPQVIFENYFGLFKNISSFVAIKEKYKMFPGSRYYGGYLFSRPSLLIKDPNLLSEMLIKNASYFNEHLSLADEQSDPMWANNLFSLKGDRWRNMRNTLSPCFSGNKLRGMVPLMQHAAENVIDHFFNKNSVMVEIEARSMFKRYCNDVIAATAYGIEVNSFDDPNNEFYEYGKKLLSFSNPSTNYKLIISLFCPTLAKLLNLKYMDDDARDFFTRITEQSIKQREEQNLLTYDVTQLLVEARKQSQDLRADQQITISNDDMVAQLLIFFFAGFDSSSTFMSFMAYELCINQDIQDRVRQEIIEVYQSSDGVVTYDLILKLKYMNMVTSETLRKWPVQPSMDRVCTKPYTISPVLPGETPVLVPSGTTIGVPIVAIHHDPEIFPNPEKFDPERFNDINKANQKPNAYLTFGIGPRNCIGSRFALLETKVLFFNLLRHFKIVRTRKTQEPIELLNSLLVIAAKDGFHMGLERI